MAKKEIKIRDDEEYITLNVLLKLADIISTGGMAKIFLQENTVLVNGEEENRRGRKLYRGDVVEVDNKAFIVKSGLCLSEESISIITVTTNQKNLSLIQV